MSKQLTPTAALVLALALAALPGSAAAQGDTTTVTLSEQNGSGESGTATLTEKGTSLEVVISLTGAPAGVAQPAHIHTGACPSPGAVTKPLTDVVDGKSTTTLANTSLADVADGKQAINVHKSAAETTVYVACGNIAKMAAAQPTATGGTAAPTAMAPAATATTTTAPAALPRTGGDSLPWLALLGFIALASGLAISRARRTA